MDPEKANAVDWSQVPLRWFQWFPVHVYITETAHVLFAFLFVCTLALSEGLREVFSKFFFLKIQPHSCDDAFLILSDFLTLF